MNIRLAEILRPKNINEVIGQEHLTGENAPIRKMIENDTLNSLIFWGPPGTGKTTLSEIIAEKSNRKFFKLSAVSSGVKEVREVIDEAKKQNLFSGKSPILFIDEIHRFSKSQQDSLLQAVEKGWIVLIGATTENPSFEVVSALLSRSQVYVLKALSYEKLCQVIDNALQKYNDINQKSFIINEKDVFIQYSGGDARKLINSVELVLNQYKNTNKNWNINGKKTQISIHKYITMASILEKESTKTDENKLIASVFLNRLAKGMKLQTDPSANYAADKLTGAPTQKELTEDSPYNTYTTVGLPPGPIASTSTISFEALNNAEKTDYLYFLHATKDGKGYFSKTYAEHEELAKKHIEGYIPSGS